MQIKEYKKLIKISDTLLQKSLKHPERLAFSELQILHPHPCLMRRYKNHGSPSLVAHFKPSLSLFASLLKPRNIIHVLRNAPFKKIDNLIISHEVGAKQAGSDFYFGMIPEKLAQQGQTVLVVKIDQRGWKQRLGDFKIRQINKRIYSGTLPGWGTFDLEWKIYKSVRNELKKIRKETPNKNNVLKKIFRSLQTGSSRMGATQNLRIYHWMRDVIGHLRPKRIFLTWEGHAWERLLIRAARETSPQALCIGYQHTIIFPHAHGPLRSMSKLYDPDHIWTVGTKNKKRLAASWEKHGVQIFVYGSPRHRKFGRNALSCKEDICVVAPEGEFGEAKILFEFGCRLAKSLPQIKILFRSHPMLPFSAVAQRCRALRALPKNISEWKYSSGGGMGNARWFLYRGTSLVCEAIEAGARPLYLMRRGEISIDPLYDLCVWKKVVGGLQQAISVIKTDLVADRSMDRSAQSRARRWSSTIFLPEKRSMAKLLQKIQKRHGSLA